MSIVFSFSWGHFNSLEKLKTMIMQNFGVTNKEHYGMLRHFWSGQLCFRIKSRHYKMSISSFTVRGLVYASDRSMFLIGYIFAPSAYCMGLRFS